MGDLGQQGDDGFKVCEGFCSFPPSPWSLVTLCDTLPHLLGQARTPWCPWEAGTQGTAGKGRVEGDGRNRDEYLG